MRISYTGNSQIRQVDQYRWAQTDLDRVQEVDDPEVLTRLVGHAGFEIADDEPLLQVATLEQVQLMALSGVATSETLATASAAKVKELAELLDVSESEIKKWIKAAKALPDPEEIEPEEPDPDESQTDNIEPEPTVEETTA